MKTSVRLEGARELDKALEELPKATGRNVMRRAATKALQPVIDTARPLVPQDEGSLKESLKVTTRLSKRQAALMRQQYRAEGKAAVNVFAGPAALPHAHLVEFGTKPRYHKKSGKFVGQMKPRPFMRPAWDSKKDDVLASFQKIMWGEIEKAAQRLARKAARDAAKAAKG
jgi:HK97 gp10 family phage protein